MGSTRLIHGHRNAVGRVLQWSEQHAEHMVAVAASTVAAWSRVDRVRPTRRIPGRRVENSACSWRSSAGRRRRLTAPILNSSGDVRAGAAVHGPREILESMQLILITAREDWTSS